MLRPYVSVDTAWAAVQLSTGASCVPIYKAECRPIEELPTTYSGPVPLAEPQTDAKSPDSNQASDELVRRVSWLTQQQSECSQDTFTLSLMQCLRESCKILSSVKM